MGLRRILVCLVMLSGFLFVACGSDKAQRVEPETRGKRGERCQARNDCEAGLACLNGVCAKNDFGLTVAPKQCDRVECQADVDCCGDKPRTAPAKCDSRAAICDTPTLPGCLRSTCTSDASCMGGVCGGGSCSVLGGACTSDAACKDTCVGGTCTKSGGTCAIDTDCFYAQYNATNLCKNRSCNCANPDYNPADPICLDPECKDICLLRCDAELCVKDNSCKADIDCVRVGLQFCDAERCVACKASMDCDETKDETCEKGLCKKPCTKNEECPIFDECQAGACVYVGCKSDRECILSASGAAAGTNVGAGLGSSEDARLLKCLPSEAEPTISTCKIPCENDGSCGSEFQVCDKGYCKFVGCENDEECRAYLGIQNQMPTDAKPFVAKAVCR